MIIGQDFANALTDVPTQMLIAPVLPTMVSDRAYAVGEQFIVNSVLYKITQAVSASGVALVVGTNCAVSDTVTEQIKNLKIGSIYSAITTGKHTTATANTYELAGSFTIDNPMVVIVRAHYSNAKPIGIVVSDSTVGNGTNKIEVASDSQPSHLSITALLDAGTYNIYTKYTLAVENNYSVYGLKFNLI